jgi:hypothetical protein
MESQGKGKSSEIEHIEEADEEAADEDDGEGFYEEAPRGREREGHALGLELGEPTRPRMGSLDSDTTASTSDERIPPMTPEDSRIGLPSAAAPSKADKGKGVDRSERVSA